MEFGVETVYSIARGGRDDVGVEVRSQETRLAGRQLNPFVPCWPPGNPSIIVSGRWDLGTASVVPVSRRRGNEWSKWRKAKEGASGARERRGATGLPDRVFLP